MNHLHHNTSSADGNTSSSSTGIANVEELSPSHLATIQTLQTKIARVKKRIAETNRKRDENVEEYLKMAATAQRNQLPSGEPNKVKALFEKRNTKAATHIAGFQRKLDRYEHELEAATNALKLASPNKKAGSPKGEGGNNSTHLEEQVSGMNSGGSSNASSYLTSKGRIVSQGIKAVVTKPKEIASYLLKQKFGSADNIPIQVSRESSGEGGGTGRRDQLTTGPSPHHHRHGSAAHIITPHGEISSASGTVNSSHHHTATGEEPTGGSHSSVSAASSRSHQEGGGGKHNSSSIPSQADIALIVQHLNEIRDDIASLREDLDNLKNTVQTDSGYILQGLQEERFRAERLEEQVNDLTELHQAETGNLKQALADAEEKLSYQSEERLRDIAEILDANQTKISRLEQQQQQLVTIEGIENSTARALAVKLVNVGLTLLQLVLLMMATVASALAPFLGSRIRIFASVFLGILAFIIHRKLPQVQEGIIEFGTDLLNRL